MDRIRLGVLSHAHGHINTYCGALRDAEDVELVASWDGEAWTVVDHHPAATLQLRHAPDGTAWIDGLTRLDGASRSEIRPSDERGDPLRPTDIAYHPDGSVWMVSDGRLWRILPDGV